jgi:hypothetical protein
MTGDPAWEKHLTIGPAASLLAITWTTGDVIRRLETVSKPAQMKGNQMKAKIAKALLTALGCASLLGGCAVFDNSNAPAAGNAGQTPGATSSVGQGNPFALGSSSGMTTRH